MLKRISFLLALLVFGAPFSPGTVLPPTVGGAALAQPGCYSVSYGSTMIFTCPLVDQGNRIWIAAWRDDGGMVQN